MAKGKHSIDKVRASRDGHEYHEAWTARKAMQLLWPDSDLAAIAVEGLSPTDQERVSAQTVEIADITLYYGGGSTFKQTSRTIIAQFKYSVSNKDEYFRASHAKKTIQKFAETYRKYKRRYGAQAVHDRLEFQLITNRPIYDLLLRAIESIACSLPQTGEVEKQARQFKTATGLNGRPLAAFAAKCKFVGFSGSLRSSKNELAGMLVNWSATSDPIAAARLGQLRDLVREKAGSAGTNQNIITRTDILAALQIGDPKDLLPCAPALAGVGKIVEREQLAEAIDKIPTLSVPLLVHAAGGVGKTVFMGSLAEKISANYEVVFFDCFGGGAYRSPEDERHLPKRGLIHIANTLAVRGLCDPILPNSPSVGELLRTFRRRLIQCVKALTKIRSSRKLVLFIDAIDNADIAARRQSDDAFPVKLLECLDTDPVTGVKLIVSCRTERKPSTYANYDKFELRPFSIAETASFLRARQKDISQTEINVAQSRSDGNPRVIEHLLTSRCGLLDESEIDNKIELNDLIQKRITDALATAIKRGYNQSYINDLLAGLAVLPPPVPLDEYAGAFSVELSAINSFASDLTPLLELTNQGLMFKDEPTETLVCDRYALSDALRRVAENLLVRQDVSVYAARALPELLHELGDSEKLFDLAFNEHIPATITSTVGKRNIRYARLKAATLHAAINQEYNRLVQLLVELSTIASTDQRGARYILDHPDLVVAAEDVDATRRLFETRTGWPGTRHAKLAIANTLSGEYEEANRHVLKTIEWIDHHRRTYHYEKIHKPGPEHPDIASIPFFLISQNKAKDAALFLKSWRDWYAYEVCEYVLDYSCLKQSIRSQPPRRLESFVSTLEAIGPLAAALSFQELPRLKSKKLIRRLAKLCKKTTKLDFAESYQRDRTYRLEDGLRKAAAVALSLGLDAEARAISLRAPHQRSAVWSFRDGFHVRDVFAFVFRTALVAAAKKITLHEKDVLPKELVPICSHISKSLTGAMFRDKAKQRVSEHVRRKYSNNDHSKHYQAMSYEDIQEAERFIDLRLEPFLSLTKALLAVLAAPARSIDKAFIGLLKIWEDACKNRNCYRSGEIDHFFRVLGLDSALFTLWARSELKHTSVKRFLKTVHDQDIGEHNLVQIVSILAKRQSLKDLAGEQAIKARALIEAENDVTYRASQFGALGRAMLPASIDEASVYFRDGLEQMDGIGSGDDLFTNELLLFASKIKGEELDERDFHTLTNICELNMGEEPEKFFWGDFGRGLSKVAGSRGLAKLSRWDDRSKISLSSTLLPYLTALVEDGKIEPKDALALNRLAKPVENLYSGTKEFAQAIRKQAGPDPEVITELIQQFEDHNPGIADDSTIEVLASQAEEALGSSSDTDTYLSAARARLATVWKTLNKQHNYSEGPDAWTRKRTDDIDRQNRADFDHIITSTDPTDETSLVQAINAFNSLQNAYELKSSFFTSLRDKVPFSARIQYVRNICGLEDFLIYWKLTELKECKQSWGDSSASLEPVYKDQAIPLIQLHADNLVYGGSLSGYILKEISDLTGVPVAELVLELIRIFVRRDNSVAGAVWLAFAASICSQAADGQGQPALKRLLNSSAAKLAGNVIDGMWVNELYPKDDLPVIAAGLVWRMLGSPHAENRWRAAHSIRCFARFGRWKIVDNLIGHISSETAGAFQASEFTFYYLHARLWLLIALARTAIDHPKKIATYKDELLTIVTEDAAPHVLMRHFAARTLLTCIDTVKLDLEEGVTQRLRNADHSPHPRLKVKERIRTRNDFSVVRPDSAPKPEFEFHLDYDFHDYVVGRLSSIFGKPSWEVTDMMSAIVQQLDPSVSSMYETGGRESHYRQTTHGISTHYHTNGQHLGWHALFIAAGKLLAAFHVIEDRWDEKDDPWGEWLERYVLTRDDGLWLSDGTDKTPLDTTEPLLETKKSGLAVTGDRDKLLRLAGLTSRVGKELVVEGTWFSSDNISVNISSALVPPTKAAMLARKLIREQPMAVGIPTFREIEEEPEYIRGKKKEFTPWIVRPSGDVLLDEHDPYGVSCANFRPFIACDYVAFCKPTRSDPFHRTWHDKRSKQVMRSQAWGWKSIDSEEGPHFGLRLFCTSSMLKKILSKNDKDLLLLIKLERYKKESFRGNGKFTHTVAVVQITKTLDLEYFKGRINYLQKPLY